MPPVRSLFPWLPLLLTKVASPRSRLSVISRHLAQRPALEINTPFSTERISGREDDLPYQPLSRAPSASPGQVKDPKMSTQPEHPALLIPGPIEFDDEVLQSMGHFRCALNQKMPISTADHSTARAMSVHLSSPRSENRSACFANSFKPPILLRNRS